MALLGSHFPQWGRELWQPIQTAVPKAQLPVHTFVADLVHLSKPRLPAVLVDIDDEELCNACEREPITLDGLKRLCHGLAVDLARRFDGITVTKGPLQERYGGTGFGVALLAASSVCSLPS